MGMQTIAELLRQQAAAQPEAVALTAPERDDLTYSGLVEQVGRLTGHLQAQGVQPGDRVALVLPDGPELAVAFLAATSGFTCAPLNPRYRQEEFEFYLSDLKAKALVTGLGVGDAAASAARDLGIKVIELTPAPDGPAGSLSTMALAAPAAVSAEPDSVALLLHTSGTTSRPKLVPLTQRSLCLSARNVARSLALTPADRCLCVMPLFHIHALVAALLGSLTAGSSIVAAPGFVATRFFDWVADLKPTWYTAVPTMHQAILARVPDHAELVASRPFRLIRSCSASMAESLMQQLEGTFKAPVVEAYGMTEAAHQIACNPLPPGERKAGSVGLPAGPEVAIMAEDGMLLAPDLVGEIVLRGDNLTSGYEDNPTANADAFRNGWFRTGDHGHLDSDGYLFIHGRIKEIINRGGEKISPREIDEVLLAHPAVAQALAFAIPDPVLGEEVGAAVVLREGVQADEHELRTAVAQRLVDFKVPRHIVFLDELPRGATGKLQRIGLADKLGITAAAPGAAAPADFVAPRNETEKLLASIWSEVLGIEQVGINDDFLDLGGDSILAAQVIARVRSAFNVEIPLIDFIDNATIAQQADMLEIGVVA